MNATKNLIIALLGLYLSKNQITYRKNKCKNIRRKLSKYLPAPFAFYKKSSQMLIFCCMTFTHFFHFIPVKGGEHVTLNNFDEIGT